MADNTYKKIDKYQFSLKDTLGVGSFGKVFKGRNEQNGTFAAVKMIDKALIQNDEYLMQGLYQEIQVMKKLKSNNVVQLYDVLETSNNYYIIQEFCNGGDFRSYLKKKKFLPESEAVKVLKDLLNGFLELLHHGIIHRDLKPENILINDNTYKLADFGFAKTVDNYKKGMLQSLVGTPLYMSPQILKHEKYSTKSDIWSLALIYYEMLAGRTPWSARSQYELTTKIMTQKLEFPQDREISALSRDFISKCLMIEEEQRISWEDLFAHPLFEGAFQEFVQRTQGLENRAQFIINQLRNKINSSDLDLEQLFIKFSLGSHSEIEIKQFSDLMKHMDPQLEREEIEYLFNKFDENGDQTIDFEEFKKWLENQNVRMSLRPQSGEHENIPNQRKQTIQGQLPLAKTEQETLRKFGSFTINPEERAVQVINRLQFAIQKYQINLQKLFTKFDKSGDGQLQLKEFAEMLKRIDDKMGDEEIFGAFQKFDTLKTGQISQQQFVQTLQYFAQQQQLQQQQQLHHQHSNSSPSQASVSTQPSYPTYHPHTPPVNPLPGIGLQHGAPAYGGYSPSGQQTVPQQMYQGQQPQYQNYGNGNQPMTIPMNIRTQQTNNNFQH